MLSCGNSPDVDDLVQTTMAKVLTRLDTFRGEAGFYMWVDRIAINSVRDHYRRQSRGVFQLYRDDWEEHQRQNSVRPDSEVDKQRVIERITAHLDRLKPEQRLPLVLHLLHGYTVPEVAAMLELSFEATKKRLLRGRKLLLDRLQKDPQCQEILGRMGS
jgi:RNA polymerase sigma-70 factor, ECF subfamily